VALPFWHLSRKCLAIKGVTVYEPFGTVKEKFDELNPYVREN